MNGRGFGHWQVLELQRRRLLVAAAGEAAEHGVAAVTISGVLRRAGVSRRTYYEIYADREGCVLDLMRDALERVATPVLAAWRALESEQWLARVRAAVLELLSQFQQDPATARLLVVEIQAAGRTTLALRSAATAAMASALDEGRARSRGGERLPAATAEGLVGGALWIVQGRLLAEPAPDLMALVGPLMSMLALPYFGPAAARRELERPLPKLKGRGKRGGARGEHGAHVQDGGAHAEQVFPVRATRRTARTLAAIRAMPGSSNRAVSVAAGIVDQGQCSKLLRRLERVGLIENAGGAGQGAPNSWRLTARGEEAAEFVVDSSEADGQPEQKPPGS